MLQRHGPELNSPNKFYFKPPETNFVEISFGGEPSGRTDGRTNRQTRRPPDDVLILHKKAQEIHTIFWLENLQGRDHLEDLGVDGKIIL
jgi:hypothetical protein